MCIRSKCLLTKVAAADCFFALSLCNLRSLCLVSSAATFPNLAKRTSVTWVEAVCLMPTVCFGWKTFVIRSHVMRYAGGLGPHGMLSTPTPHQKMFVPAWHVCKLQFWMLPSKNSSCA